MWLDKIRVIIKSSPTATIYWLLQYIQYVEITGPKSIKDRVIDI